QNPSFLQENTKYFLMDEISSFDIDNLEDLEKAKRILK
ncbi:acylneuraminate cytidylyltransferase family protein, partial [Campylobacter coli]|nr:acylneuraminate cytidylyltransferase family protein [Campylobacter coli]